MASCEWVIDIVQEWVEAQGYLTTGFVDRGDPPAWDFTQASFISNLNWHELDLSAIVPENAKAVVMRGIISTNAVQKYIQFRKHGNVNTIAAFHCITVVAPFTHSFTIIVAVDADRKIDYRATAAVWNLQHFVILGWWL